MVSAAATTVAAEWEGWECAVRIRTIGGDNKEACCLLLDSVVVAADDTVSRAVAGSDKVDRAEAVSTADGVAVVTFVIIGVDVDASESAGCLDDGGGGNNDDDTADGNLCAGTWLDAGCSSLLVTDAGSCACSLSAVGAGAGAGKNAAGGLCSSSFSF
jgi:hypothetical protein